MFARTLGMTVFGIALCGLFLQAGLAQDKAKDKAKDQAQDKKFEIPKDVIVGTVKSVNLKESHFTIKLESGKDKTFAVTSKTEFWGPKGGDRGTGPDGLKDDCMEKGYMIKVDATKDGKNAKNVYLPVRKSDEKK